MQDIAVAGRVFQSTCPMVWPKLSSERVSFRLPFVRLHDPAALTRDVARDEDRRVTAIDFALPNEPKEFTAHPNDAVARSLQAKPSFPDPLPGRVCSVSVSAKQATVDGKRQSGFCLRLSLRPSCHRCRCRPCARSWKRDAWNSPNPAKSPTPPPKVSRAAIEPQLARRAIQSSAACHWSRCRHRPRSSRPRNQRHPGFAHLLAGRAARYQLHNSILRQNRSARAPALP